MDIKNVYANIMTSDIEVANKWYNELFGRKSSYNPMPGLHEWDFYEGGVLQLVQDKERAGQSSITLMVRDIEKVKMELVKKDINLGEQTSSGLAKTITIYDPENNRITFAENLEGR